MRALVSFAQVLRQHSFSEFLGWLGASRWNNTAETSLTDLPWSVPTQILSVPLLRRKILQPSPEPEGCLDPSIVLHREQGWYRSEWTTSSSLRVTFGLLTVGRRDGYCFESVEKHVGANSKSSMPALDEIEGGFCGELQTRSAVLRFDAHINGIR